MSNRSLTHWLAFLAGTYACAQPEAVRTKTDSGWVTTHFYLSGEVAATEWRSSSADKSGFTCFKKNGSIQWQKEWPGLFEAFKFKAHYQTNGAVNSIEFYDPRLDADTCIAHRWAWPPYAPDVLAWTDTIIPPRSHAAREPVPPPMEEIHSPGAPAATPVATPFYTTAFFVIKGKLNVKSVRLQAFDQNGTLCETVHAFGWLDTLGIGTLLIRS